ncbi:TIR domain-containing protein [Amycolatopsis mongoliensis]|uniref:TIR domain-containing protein n=1 Tax=Amycolatopsis mongoliensis TaxID=715475 RepID=A0A9Y2NMS2_9PSEU|nr:toll/interleukin-1 receptor domain-containing protein [Amycolatopsis sp. 4-36]WIY05133.1 TIR domain-containing protein [Amycolatopsis sp. 4-36]
MTGSYDIFLSFTWADSVEVNALQDALEAAGLRVFRDKEIRRFEGITEKLDTALAESKVLLAYYSRRFPTRYACQWELTSAFLAAQRLGDPRRRVLVVNPESDGNHIAPVELEDAAYCAPPKNDQERAITVKRVAEMVRAAGTPLGSVRSTAPVLPRLLRPRRFVGRYRQLWAIHSALHARELPATTLRTSSALAVVRGIAGLGKTSLAEQYAFLFRDAFPGGVRWLGLYGSDDPVGAVARFHSQVRAIGEELGADVGDLPAEQARSAVARRVEAAGKPQLWIIDDVPSELSGEVLDQLVMPTSFVRTVLTTRSGNPDWPAPVVELTGLSEDEGSALYTEIVGSDDPEELAAARRLVERCGGHPIVLTSAVTALRDRRGAVDPAGFAEVLDEVKGTGVLADAVAGCEPTAQRILRIAAAISRAPVPAELVRRVLPGEPVDQAVAELARRALLIHLGTEWDIHALVRDAAGLDDDLTRTTASVVLELTGNTGRLHQHAAALAEHDCVPAEQRARLLRIGLDWFRGQGDVVAAREAAKRLLAADAGPADRVAAAAALVDAGDFAEAAEVCRPLVDSADAFHARLTCARALDQLGRFAEADPIWPEPSPDDERTDARVFMVVAKRMRGRFREALDLLDPDDPNPRARLEIARLRGITGDLKPARAIAEGVIREHDSPDHERHPVRLEAIGVHTEVEMAVDLTEFKVRDENWDALEAQLRSARDELTGLLGAESPLALAAGVRCARTSITRGRPKRALREFGDLEPRVREVFRDHHPLHHWLSYSTAQAHAQLKRYDTVVGILRPLLDRQRDSIGRHHPDTMRTQLDLGIALMLTGDKAAAVPLVAEAERRIGEALGWRAELRNRAWVTGLLMNLPVVVWQLFPHLDNLFGKKSPEED